MEREAELEETEAGLVPRSAGWFVANVRDLRWSERPGMGRSCALTGRDEYEAETFFPLLGMSIKVVAPGEPTTTYHWETEQEDFLVLAGEGVAIVDGQERPVRQWDFVHCPPGTKHAFAGAGDGGMVLLCASSRQFQKDGPWGFYCPDPVAAAYNAASPEETQDGELAYERFGPSRLIRYLPGLLPSEDGATVSEP
jgi:mannose-6-phosphate isomerase-like protein (cupin superfamily)